MTSHAASDARSVGVKTRPYAPSWMDALIAWLSRLPGPSWVTYALIFLAVAGVLGSFPAFGGEAPLGTIDLGWALIAFYPVYTLGATAYLNGVARRAVDSFRPALNVDGDEAARLRFEVSTFPAGPGATIGIAMAVLIALWRASAPIDVPGGIPVLRFVEAAGACLAYALVGVFVARTARLLQLVSQIQARATAVDLFQPSPLYAFSNLTVRVAIVVLTVVVVSSLLPASATDQPPAVELATVIVEIAFASVVFIAPLLGMHQRILAEKLRLLDACGSRMKRAIEELNGSVDARDDNRAEAINQNLSSLALERAEIERMSTWPWRLGTLGAFLAAVAVPILAWLATRLLERLV
jgi:hypothetical protein